MYQKNTTPRRKLPCKWCGRATAISGLGNHQRYCKENPDIKKHYTSGVVPCPVPNCPICNHHNKGREYPQNRKD